MTTGPTDQRCCVAGANGGCKYIVNYLNVFFFVSVLNHHFPKIEILYVHQFVLKRVHGTVIFFTCVVWKDVKMKISKLKYYLAM